MGTFRSNKRRSTISSSYEWHEEYLTEEFPTVLEYLGDDGARIVQIDKTEKGVRFVECCDGYYGTTLSIPQAKRLILELQEMVGDD